MASIPAGGSLVATNDYYRSESPFLPFPNHTSPTGQADFLLNAGWVIILPALRFTCSVWLTMHYHFLTFLKNKNFIFIADFLLLQGALVLHPVAALVAVRSTQERSSLIIQVCVCIHKTEHLRTLSFLEIVGFTCAHIIQTSLRIKKSQHLKKNLVFKYMPSCTHFKNLPDLEVNYGPQCLYWSFRHLSVNLAVTGDVTVRMSPDGWNLSHVPPWNAADETPTQLKRAYSPHSSGLLSCFNRAMSSTLSYGVNMLNYYRAFEWNGQWVLCYCYEPVFIIYLLRTPQAGLWTLVVQFLLWEAARDDPSDRGGTTEVSTHLNALL